MALRRKAVPKYYNLEQPLKKMEETGAKYLMVFGGRSDGKTWAGKEHVLRQYLETGAQGVYLRRMVEDIRGYRGESLFKDMIEAGTIERITDGKWGKVKYRGRAWYLARYDEDLNADVVDGQPFMFALALTDTDHNKSTSYAGVKTVIFDEFLSRTAYLTDEFTLFMNTLSTIIRDRDDVKIFMFGNTVTQYCPYFREMGIRNVKQMKPGDMDVYEYGDSGLRVIVQYSDVSIKSKRASNVYFAFDNPKLRMITGGEWELAIYPHLPYKYERGEVFFEFFIRFGDELLHAELISHGNDNFAYVHRKTTPIKDEDTAFVYEQGHSPSPYHRRRLTLPKTQLDRRILGYFQRDKVYYQDNEVGETVRNYLLWSNRESIISA